MSSRVHQIQLSDDMERRLHEHAAATGTDADTFILRAVEEKLAAPRSFKEIFGPMQDAFSDDTEGGEPVEQMFERLRQAVREARREDRP